MYMANAKITAVARRSVGVVVNRLVGMGLNSKYLFISSFSPYNSTLVKVLNDITQ